MAVMFSAAAGPPLAEAVSHSEEVNEHCTALQASRGDWLRYNVKFRGSCGKEGPNKSMPFWRAVHWCVVVNWGALWQCVTDAICALYWRFPEKRSFLPLNSCGYRVWSNNLSFVLYLQNKSILWAVWSFIPEVNKRKSMILSGKLGHQSIGERKHWRSGF